MHYPSKLSFLPYLPFLLLNQFPLTPEEVMGERVAKEEMAKMENVEFPVKMRMNGVQPLREAKVEMEEMQVLEVAVEMRVLGEKLSCK
jgi:hypothetical protein